MARSRLLALALGVLVWVASAPALADAVEEESHLRILLTNDDGIGAPGLRILRAALEAAGHDVTVVAPIRDRSGSSVSITTHGKLTLHRIDARAYSVDGTPADCVRLALTLILEEKPELVVAGVNFGQNVGAGTIYSGTVGAAVTAAAMGVPSIAVSQTVDPGDVQQTPRYFPDAAALATELVGLMAERDERPLLPRGVTLNVNHPPLLREARAGVKLTRQGRSTLYELVYARAPDGTIRLSFARNPTPETVPDADTTALAAGYATLTPLDGTWTAGPEALKQLEPLARALAGPPRARAEAAAGGR